MLPHFTALLLSLISGASLAIIFAAMESAICGGVAELGRLRRDNPGFARRTPAHSTF